MSTPGRPGRAAGRLLAIVLLVLSPVCGEYVVGYDESTGDLPVLAASLLIFGPLYGAPAILLRELSRRFGKGWPTILTLATAFGILQAGVIDQSLFSTNYREIDYWNEMIGPTWIAPIGLSAYTVLVFVGGHTIWSFGIPIALVEGLSPSLAHRPWLRWPGLTVMGLLYLAAAWLVLDDHLKTESEHATAAQVAGSLGVAGLLMIVAFLPIGRRLPDREHAAPTPLAVGGASLLASLGFNFVSSTWAGFTAALAILIAAAGAFGHLSRSTGWGPRHVIAIASGALLGRALLGFLVEPLGDVEPVAKYTHNIVCSLGAVGLGLWAASRHRLGKAPVMAGEGRALPD